MNPLVEDVLEQARDIWRMRWLVVAVAWGLGIVGWLVVLSLPDIYEAKARVYVDTRTALSPVLAGIAVEQDVESELDQVRQALLSRPYLETVARTVRPGEGALTPSGMDALVESLRNDIWISFDRRGNEESGDTLYTITYRHTKRETCLEVVKAILDTFVEGTLGSKREGSESAQAFLREQINDYANRLSEAEARLADFKKRNVGLVPGEKGDFFSRLASAMEARQKAVTNLAIAVSKRAELGRQLGSSRPFVAGSSVAPGSGSSSSASSDLSARIQENEARLQDLLVRFTEKHPEVLALRNTITELKAQEKRELAEISRGGSGTGAIRSLSANPVHQSIQMQINQVEVDIASLRGEMAQHDTTIAELRRVVDSAPEVERELARLDRDYDVTKTQYTALVTRLEKARLSDDAERTGIVKFQVLDPPAAGFQPVTPNRKLLILAVLCASIGGGVAFAFLWQKLRPTFGTERSLADLTGLVVLGCVSLFASDRERRHTAMDRNRLIAALAAFVLVCFVLLLANRPAARAVRAILM